MASRKLRVLHTRYASCFCNARAKCCVCIVHGPIPSRLISASAWYRCVIPCIACQMAEDWEVTGPALVGTSTGNEGP